MSQNSTKCELQISSKLLKKILARAFNSEVKTPEQLQSSKLLLLKQAQNRDMYRAQKLSRDWRENFQRLRKKEKTSIRQDLNPQPPNYEACALPLCYNCGPKDLKEYASPIFWRKSWLTRPEVHESEHRLSPRCRPGPWDLIRNTAPLQMGPWSWCWLCKMVILCFKVKATIDILYSCFDF